MTESDIQLLKSHIDKVVQIETHKGERLLINVLSVFDEESDADVFFHDVSADPEKRDFEKMPGFALSLNNIVSVREYTPNGDRA